MEDDDKEPQESVGGGGVMLCRELEAGFGSSERILTQHPQETSEAAGKGQANTTS